MSKDIDYHRKDYSINIDFQNFALKNAFKGILENDEYYKSLDLKCEIVVINSIAKDGSCHLQEGVHEGVHHEGVHEGVQ
jgi:hypothetical protein